MDSRRTLSIIAHSASVRSPSHTTISSVNDDQNLEIDGLNDLTGVNLQRRRSSGRVSFYQSKKKNNNKR